MLPPFILELHYILLNAPSKRKRVGQEMFLCLYYIFHLTHEFNPLSPSIQIQTLKTDIDPYISCKNWLREFDSRSKLFPSGDYFIDSHNIFL